MAPIRKSIEFTIEIQSPDGEGPVLREGSWEDQSGTRLRLVDREQGHGFGIAETVKVVADFAHDVSANLVAAAIIAGVGGIIRRVRSKSGRADGTVESIGSLIEKDRGVNLLETQHNSSEQK